MRIFPAMGGKESKPSAPSRRRTRSSSAKGKEVAPEGLEVDDDASPSKKLKSLDNGGEVSKDAALARALEALSEEANADPQEQTKEEQEVAAAASSLEVLVTVPNARVHLMDHGAADDQSQSVLLASGELTIARIVQNGQVVAALVKLGDELKWPLAKDAPVLKLSENHYVFSLRVSVVLEDEEGDEAAEQTSSLTPNVEVLNYGVTFPADTSPDILKELDSALGSYSSLVPVPALVRDPGDEFVELEQQDHDQGIAGMKLTAKTKNYYLDQLAPNADDYQSAVAKAIATGSAHVIRGILWMSEVIAMQIERSGLLLQQHVKPKKKPSRISPKTMKSIRT